MADVHVEDMTVGITITDETVLTPAQERRIAALVRREFDAMQRDRAVSDANTRLTRSASQGRIG